MDLRLQSMQMEKNTKKSSGRSQIYKVVISRHLKMAENTWVPGVMSPLQMEL